MTNLEAVAKVMGWEFMDGVILTKKEGGFIGHDFDEIETAKLLQQRMVEDNWIVEITNYIAAPKFCVVAFLGPGDVRRVIAEAATEPAAIVALFEKVYGIGG